MTITYSPRRLLTENEVADVLHVEPPTLRRWRWAGTGPRFVKLNSAVRYHPEDINAFVTAGRRTSTSDPGPEVARP